jgi:predicted enzyme related to lactoylglutathione lyase
MSVRITRVAFVYHRVTDIVRARDFYERVLGMKVALDYEGAPGKWWIEYDVDGVAFAITNVGAPNGNGGAMPTFEVADIEAAAKALRTAGAMFVEPLTEYPRCRSFTVTDPDGNQIGFHQLKPAEEVPKFVPSLAERWNLTFTHQAAERLLIASGMVTVTSISFHRWASMSPQKVKKA